MSSAKKTTLKLDDIQTQIASLMAGEDRKDVEFRLALAMSQLGDVAKYITHDPELNPQARPHGSRQDEQLSFGQLLVQILAVASLRKINLDQALEMALTNWQGRDWKGVEVVNDLVNSNVIVGLVAEAGVIEGVAFVDPDGTHLSELPIGCILVVKHAKPEFALYFKDVRAVVTDQGGRTCHAAIIARELGKTCLVGTGNATQLIKNGQKIRVEAGFGEEKGRVICL